MQCCMGLDQLTEHGVGSANRDMHGVCLYNQSSSLLLTVESGQEDGDMNCYAQCSKTAALSKLLNMSPAMVIRNP